MVQSVVPGEGCLDIDAEAVLDRFLPHVVTQVMRPERLLHRAVLREEGSVHQSVIHESVSSNYIPAIARRASRISSSGLSLWSRTWLTAFRASVEE